MKSPLHRLRAEKKFLATIACALLLSPAPARALNIVLVYDDLGENPSWDRNGTALMAIADAAAARWERLIPSPGTHTIDVSWSRLEGSQLGLWKFDPFGNNNIYFDAGTDWFIDPTPNSDSEFDFGDPLEFTSEPGSFLAGPDPSALWFDGTDPPATLEVGHFGNGISGEANDDYDLLSVVLHEMGHELGVAGDFLSGRYPIYPNHVLGRTGVEAIEGNSEGDDGGIGYYEEHGHLAPPFALMSAQTEAGVRTLPSATDVLVAARDSNYTSVDLVRKFAGRTGDWGDTLDWIGGRLPDADDAVFIVHGGTTTLSGARTADSVAINDNSLLDAIGDLAIDRELRIGSTGKLRSAFGSEISAATLDARIFSEIELTGGRLVLGGGTLAANAKISGRGTIETSGTLRIDGLVDAVNTDLAIRGAGTLRLSHPADSDVRALLRARDGNLGLETSFTTDSVGYIEVFGGRNLTALADVTIPANVLLNLLGSTGSPAIINSIGANVDLTIRDLRVGGENGIPGNAEIHSRTVTLEDDAIVFGPLTLASSVLTTLRGGLYLHDGSSSGRLVQAGDISVEGGLVSIVVDEFDWGNSTSSQTNALNIHQNATLNVWCDSLGSATNQFRGNLQLDSGVLYVQGSNSWDLPAPSGTTPGGTLSMIHNGTADPIVRGAPFTARDYLLVSGGDAFIEADLTVAPTASVVIFGNSSLFLDGDTTMNGGSYTGLGSLIQRGDIDVIGDTTIAVEEFAWGNSFGTNFHALTVHEGATLTVDSPGTGDPDNQFRGLVRLEGGDLVVNTDIGWTLPASGLLQIGGTLQLHNNGTTPHLRGQPVTFGAGVAVTGGAAYIGSDSAFLTTCETDIAAGAILHVSGSTTYRGTFTGQGTLQHNGSALHTTSTPLLIPHMVQRGLFTAFNPSGESKLFTHTLAFASPSETRLISDLRISGIASVTPGATFNGSGTLIVTESLSGAGTIGVDVRNEGTLRPGPGAGLLSIGGDYTQTGTGSLDVEIGGITVSLFDRLSITGTATLSGGVNVSLIGGFVPSLGQKFQILSAPGSVSGAFTALTQPAGMPGNLAFSVLYTASAVTLTVVPTTPYESWINSFGAITDLAQKTRDADPDNDGLSNRAEFAIDGNPASGLATGKVAVKIAPVGATEALTLTLPVRAEARPDSRDPAGGELVLRQSADAVTWTIQASGNVAQWLEDVTEVTGPDAATIQLGLPALNAGWVYRTFRSPGPVTGAARGFIRATLSD